MSGLYSTPTWKRLRAAQLHREPWCRLCLERGIRTKATTVDHIKPHRGRWELFADPSNLQSLDATCHNAVKQAQERTGTLRGCDERGWPLDERHWWRKS